MCNDEEERISNAGLGETKAVEKKLKYHLSSFQFKQARWRQLHQTRSEQGHGGTDLKAKLLVTEARTSVGVHFVPSSPNPARPVDLFGTLAQAGASQGKG